MHWPDQPNEFNPFENNNSNNGIPPFLDGLNEPQQQAVIQTDGPVMIIAGAGSGKTRVITYRIAYLLQKGVDAFQILALTFTNKAAKEMRNRIESVAGGQAKNLWMGTFHSIFARVLRQEAERIGYPSSFTIYDTEDSKSLLKTIIKEMNLDDKVYKTNMVLGRISMAKNNLLEAHHYLQKDDLIAQDTAASRPKFAEIFSEYTKRCFKAGAMDFDDILLNTYKLLNNHLDVCNKWQHKFKYIMVDEYQDTNHVQYMITKKLAAVNQNICVVGDDAQSIYAFRGANIQNILNFERDYPEVKIYKLEQNYRSTKNIVNAASSVIKNNKKQLEKEVWTANDEGDKIKLIHNSTEGEEARKVADYITEIKLREHFPNKAFAILYRTNSQSRAFEEALRRQGLDYKIYGGMSFYQRKEVKDLLSYLRLTVNPTDEEALKRVINYPGRGIGDTTINRLILLSAQHGVPLWDIVKSARSFPELSTAIPKLENFALMMQSFMTMLDSNNAFDVATHVAKQSGLLRLLYEDKSVEGVSRYENITELLNGIQQFTEDDESEKEKTLPNFLEEVALYTDEEKDKDQNRDTVSLMTIHASKGLEFPVVFIVGLEENLFPSQMALHSRAELEEERRLFYVAITRAEQKLFLNYATSRFKYGSLIPCEPSRFIEEIDSKFLDMSIVPKKPTFDEDFDGFGGGFGQGGGYSGNRGGGNYGNRQGGNRGNNSGDKSNAGGYIQRHGTGNGKKPGDSDKPTKPSTLLQPKRPTSAPLPPADPNFVEGDLSGLKVGDRVQHQRFGTGTVQSLEGNFQTGKAVVLFDQVGEKTLVLKFAKMRIL